MENIENKPINLSKLSKPIELKTKDKGFFDKVSDFFQSKPEINILSTSPKPQANPENKTSEIKLDQDPDKNHSQTSNHTLAEGFFADNKDQTALDTKIDESKNKSRWFKQKEYDSSDSSKTISEEAIEISDSKPVSLMWLIGGAITIIIVIVMILASFGLVNLIKVGIEENSLSDTQQAIKTTTDYLTQGNLELAVESINDVIEKNPENPEALALLKRVNQQAGDDIIEQISEYKNISTVDENYLKYQDSNNHFSILYSPDLESIDTNYDVKYSYQEMNIGVKKYPNTNSLSKLENKFLSDFTGKDYTVMSQKENTSFYNSNAKIYVIKIDNMYQISVLMQKYYFGYEISAWIPTKNYEQYISLIQNSLASFSLVSDYEIENYDQLEITGDERIAIHSFPSVLSPDEKNKIISDMSDSVSFISQSLLIGYQGKIEVYLYPDFETLYQYTLSENSFSDYISNTIHIVYINAGNHQSYGYETTKIMYQKAYGEVFEPMVLEGIAVILDQTGRDYVQVVRDSEYIPLEQLLGVNWDLNHTDLKYHEAGIFTGYLIEKYGIDLYTDLSFETDFPYAYQKIYDKSLTVLESEFKTALEL